jgi:class 3 adenylate cyclase
MPLRGELADEVLQIFSSQWDTQNTNSVPDPEDLRLGNHAKNLDQATVLYADLNGSTSMVDQRQWWFAAEVYKAYLRCAARIIRSEGGEVTAYDGDRIMAIFTGDSKNTSAVRAAMKINFAVTFIINPQLKASYSSTDFTVGHVVGVDTSSLRAARIGVRGYNDLVWIGRAANYAAKLTTLAEKPLWITKAVYDQMHQQVKIHDASHVDMWTKRLWTPMKNMEIYCSDYSYHIA